MAYFLAVVAGLIAWPFLSYTYPTLLSQIPLGAFKQHALSLNKDSVITPRLSTFIEKTMALGNITGLSVAVTLNSGETEFHSFGYRTEDGDEVTPDTLFNMASVSKAFCATAVGLLIDDFAHGNNVTALPPGLTGLTWHTRLADLLPDWELMDKVASKSANLRDILSHVSGMPRHDFSYGPSDDPQDTVAQLRYLRPAFELREQWSYNNIMYMVAAHVITTYSGQSYTSFVEERIFTPLKMTSSTFSPMKAEATGKYTQGWSKGGRRVPASFTEEAALSIAGAGGIISNAVDMAKWISTWIGEGVRDNQTVIPASVYRNASYSYVISEDHPPNPDYSIVGYGTGWFRSAYRGHDIVYHAGAVPWLSTLVTFLPADKIGVTLFANGESKAESLTLIQNHILDSALGLSSSLLVTPTSPSSPTGKPTTVEHSYHNIKSSLNTFAGTYVNPGYGSFTLCSPSSASAYCASVRSDFSAIDSIRDDSGTDDLLAEWPRMWASHVRMRHQQGSTFEVYLTTLYPNGWGRDTTPFESAEMGRANGLAEFVIEDGRVVGFGVLPDELTERARKHKTVQDRAEVWFDKV